MKKLFLLLLVSLALSGCGSDEQTSSDSCNNYIFSEIVIDGTRGYCVTGYLGTEENLNLSIPKSYNGFSVIGVSFDHSFCNEHCFFNNNNLESIYFPSTIKLINLDGMYDSIDDDKTRFIFDADVKHIICDDKGYEDRISKIFFNGSLDEFTGSNLDSVFRVSDVYFKEGNEYKCKIERHDEIKAVFSETSKICSEICNLISSLSSDNSDIALPTSYSVEYKGSNKTLYFDFKLEEYNMHPSDIVRKQDNHIILNTNLYDITYSMKIDIKFIFSYKNLLKTFSYIISITNNGYLVR